MIDGKVPTRYSSRIAGERAESASCEFGMLDAAADGGPNGPPVPCSVHSRSRVGVFACPAFKPRINQAVWPRGRIRPEVVFS